MFHFIKAKSVKLSNYLSAIHSRSFSSKTGNFNYIDFINNLFKVNRSEREALLKAFRGSGFYTLLITAFKADLVKVSKELKLLSSSSLAVAPTDIKLIIQFKNNGSIEKDIEWHYPCKLSMSIEDQFTTSFLVYMASTDFSITDLFIKRSNLSIEFVIRYTT
jgi:hypothetical protein